MWRTEQELQLVLEIHSHPLASSPEHLCSGQRSRSYWGHVSHAA